ncbi:CobW family GTP-binding protein [Methanococcus maripaludis]|uniref:Putative cobalamin synthesis protein n=1 Tax=Methanococcus maripaludis OS7 TaxID=637915 RepID=A0A2Z5PIZ2_METMI|nr:GTP-binding protein [Methanococcus maripaludis]BAP62983.1 putative cobalamin synthesis protein [Methanococcus maripaludis OS7]
MVKIDVVSGYLGSGKTTFIKHLLNACGNEKVIVIENEFGEIAIDGDLIKNEGFEVYELQQGCICCSIRSNFIEALGKIVDEFNPDRIIVEPTGMGLLSEIIGILSLPKIKQISEINSLTTVVDAENYLEEVEGFGEFFKDQIKNADRLIISKAQFMNYQEIDKILSSLRELNADSLIVTQNWEFMAPEEFLKILDNSSENSGKIYRGNVEAAMKGVSSIGLEFTESFKEKDIENIILELKSGKYGQIMRGKGFLNIDDKTMEFNYVGNDCNLELLNTKKDQKICIIGKNLEKEAISELFNNL